MSSTEKPPPPTDMTRALSIFCLLAGLQTTFALCGFSPPALAAPVIEVRDRLTLEVSPIQRTSGGILIQGRVLQQANQDPGTDLTVRISFGESIETSQTNSDGYFSQYFPDRARKGQLTISVEPTAFLDAARYQGTSFDISKRPVTVGVEEPPSQKRGDLEIEIADAGQPPSLKLLLLAFALTTSGLLTFVALRTRPWRRWSRGKHATKSQKTHKTSAGKELPRTGFVPQPTTRRARISRTQYCDFHGKVVSAIDQSPIAEAAICVEGDPTSQWHSDRKGCFRAVDLPAGTLKFQICARTYASEHFTATVPHHGSLHGATIALLPVREKIFDMYKEALHPHLPDARLWGIWTPKRILAHVRASRPNPELVQLTDFVEQSFFSQPQPCEEILPEAKRLVRAFEKRPTEPAQERRPIASSSL